MESDRHYAVLSKLMEYVSSPSLRHIRDPRNLQKLAEEIARTIDASSGVWTKWNGQREDLAKAAAPCWIPIEDLQAFLNQLPGPLLTRTDVVERLRAFWEEPWERYPDEDLRDGCLALYQKEKAEGTEMPAIVGAIRVHIEDEEERLRKEREQAHQRFKEEERLKAQERFLSGADCGWIQLDKTETFYCRRNGRAFRTTRAKDKRWNLYRVRDQSDDGLLLGTYQGRREASEALKQIAYTPEPPVGPFPGCALLANVENHLLRLYRNLLHCCRGRTVAHQLDVEIKIVRDAQCSAHRPNDPAFSIPKGPATKGRQQHDV